MRKDRINFDVNCFVCGKVVKREAFEIRRQKKHFCNSCVKGTMRTTRLSKFVNASFSSTKRRAFKKNLDFDLKKEYIEELFKTQNGKCAVTGLDLVLKDRTTDQKHPRQPSIDRIDNSKGYTKDNIQIICLIVNYSKNSFDNKDIEQFYKELIQTTGR